MNFQNGVRMAAAALMAATVFAPITKADAKVYYMGFKTIDGKDYWYENGIRQGCPGDPKNIWDTVYGVERGREIYDPSSDAWYWLDACYDGAAAKNKEVWMPYIYQEDLKTGENKQGKWVRYDNKGRMIKGSVWVGYASHWVFYDFHTGEMYKGDRFLWPDPYADGESEYHFDTTNGHLQFQSYNPKTGDMKYKDQDYGQGLGSFFRVEQAMPRDTRYHVFTSINKNSIGALTYSRLRFDEEYEQ